MDEKKTPPKTKSKPTLLIVAGVILVIIVLLALAFRLVGQKIKDKVASTYLSALLSKQTGGQVRVEEGGNKVSYSGKEGEFSFGEDNKLPNNFPSGFPVYPGSKVTSSWSADSSETKGLSVMMETGDSSDKVAKYFEDELPKAGWQITSSFKNESSTTFSFEKDKQSGFVGITREDNKTTVSITVSL